jgi:DNA/RNA endonuclease G (NUC1)
MDDNKEYTTFQDAIDLISENLRSIENFLCGKEEVDYQEEYELMRSLRYLLTYMRSKKQGTISKSTTKQEKDKEAERLMDFFKKKDNINSDGTLKKGDYKGNGLDFL